MAYRSLLFGLITGILMINKNHITLLICLFLFMANAPAQTGEISHCNISWDSQSNNASQSMPCGGGDIGLNVWVENDELLIYLSKSGTFDENNTFLKLGRIRIKLSPNPFKGNKFKQELSLEDGAVKINASDGKLAARFLIWVDVYRPVIHIGVNGSHLFKAQAAYESWRYRDRVIKGKEANQSSYKFANQDNTYTYADSIHYANNAIEFYHHNRDTTIFDVTVKQQGMEAVKAEMYNPLKNITFGGSMHGATMERVGTYTGVYLNTDFKGWKLENKAPVRSQTIDVDLYTIQSPRIEDWQSGLQKVIADVAQSQKTAYTNPLKWWRRYWEQSFIYIEPANTNVNTTEWQAGRNYQLFRYMLGCNAYGSSPTKFNGGLFTYDPVLTDSTYKFTPDFRNWGGGLMTAQNQRLVDFPVLKSGDWEMLKPQFNFYLQSLHNAELRSRVYWNHQGACFTEQ